MSEMTPQQSSPPEFIVPRRPSFLVRVLRVIGEILQTVFIAALLFIAVNLVTARIRVEGSSMEPSLHDGEFVVVNRLAYRWSQPSRGDIIVFNFPLDPQRRFIKRIIGLPGDTVSAHSNHIYVNGIPLSEPYIAAPVLYTGQWVVGENEVFVLGDNRNNSSDSQNWGPLPEDEIIGRAELVYWPPDAMGLIPHYNLAMAAPE
jgi:signal peptidase I